MVAGPIHYSPLTIHPVRQPRTVGGRLANMLRLLALATIALCLAWPGSTPAQEAAQVPLPRERPEAVTTAPAVPTAPATDPAPATTTGPQLPRPRPDPSAPTAAPEETPAPPVPSMVTPP